MKGYACLVQKLKQNVDRLQALHLSMFSVYDYQMTIDPSIC